MGRCNFHALAKNLIKFILKGVLRALYRVKVVGLDNYKNAGDHVVIIANHTSLLDGLLLATFLPDTLTFAVNTFAVKKWWARLFTQMIDAYPLDPTKPTSLKSLIHYLEQKKKCVIFPEGRLSITGTIMKIYQGPGFIADKTGSKLLPIRIEGAQLTPFAYLKGKVRIRWMPKITLSIFPAYDLCIPAELKGRKRRAYGSNKIYDLMTLTAFQNSPYQQSLFARLLHAKSIYGKRHIIAEDIERKPWTYAQLITRSFVLGTYMKRLIGHEENVGLLLPSSCAALLCIFSLQLIKRVPVMLNFSMGDPFVLLACKTANVKTLISSRRFIEMARLETLITRIQQTNIKLIYLEDIKNSITLLDKLKGFFMALMPHYFYQPHKVNAHSPAVILFTSGTEGTPKGVVLSHENIQANCFQLMTCIDFMSTDKVFNALPLFHSFGLTGGLFLPILFGVKTFFYPSPLHYRMVPELAYDTNSTILFATDTFLTRYAKFAHPYDFHTIRYVFAGAEKLQAETQKIWSDKFGLRILEGYGVTEASPVIAVNTPMQNRLGSVGKFLPGIQYQLQSIPDLVDGKCLLVQGPNIMQGYLRTENPGVLEPPANGWHNTGDIVRIDEEGYLYILGRAKRFAKIAGEMISLPAIESYITQLWPQFHHAVISMPDEKKGEQLILVTEYEDANRAELLAFAKVQMLNPLMIPKKILYVEKLPLSSVGKINYPAVQALCLKLLP